MHNAGSADSPGAFGAAGSQVAQVVRQLEAQGFALGVQGASGTGCSSSSSLVVGAQAQGTTTGHDSSHRSHRCLGIYSTGTSVSSYIGASGGGQSSLHPGTGYYRSGQRGSEAWF